MLSFLQLTGLVIGKQSITAGTMTELYLVADLDRNIVRIVTNDYVLYEQSFIEIKSM